MSDQSPTIVLVHGAFPESESSAWKDHPSWFAFGEQDLNIRVALERFLPDRAFAKETREMAGASQALTVTEPDAVTASILDAVASV
jgi:hypothetical protein